MLPAFLGKLHPRYNTPVNAIIMIGVISSLAPFFGRPTLVWLVDAGGLGIVIAFFFVALSFIVLRLREPEMERPFRVRFGLLVGGLAAACSLGMILLYLPGSPSALLPVEWLIFAAWMLFGLAMYLWSRTRYGVATASRSMERELAGRAR